MGQGFGDEIAKVFGRFVVLVFAVGAIVGVGLYFAMRWIMHHVAVNWK